MREVKENPRVSLTLTPLDLVDKFPENVSQIYGAPGSGWRYLDHLGFPTV